MTGVTYGQVRDPDPNHDATHLPPLSPLPPLILTSPCLGCLRFATAATSQSAGVLTFRPAAATHNRPIG